MSRDGRISRAFYPRSVFTNFLVGRNMSQVYCQRGYGYVTPGQALVLQSHPSTRKGTGNPPLNVARNRDSKAAVSRHCTILRRGVICISDRTPWLKLSPPTENPPRQGSRSTKIEPLIPFVGDPLRGREPLGYDPISQPAGWGAYRVHPA